MQGMGMVGCLMGLVASAGMIGTFLVALLILKLREIWRRRTGDKPRHK